MKVALALYVIGAWVMMISLAIETIKMDERPPYSPAQDKLKFIPAIMYCAAFWPILVIAILVLWYLDESEE